MTSQHIRWIIAGLFVAFLAVVILSDLISRKPKKPKARARRPRDRGFRAMRTDRPEQGSSWKNPSRR
jgi:hypothetical protein